MEDTWARLNQNMTVGQSQTVIIATTIAEGDNTADAKNVTTGTTFLCLDPDRQTNGTATSTGSTNTIVDTSRTEADDTWKGVTLEVRDDTTDERYRTKCTASTASTTTLEVQGLPFATAVGDTYVFDGYPLLTETAAGMSTNQGTITLTGSDATMYSGRRLLVYHADYGTDAEDQTFEFEVE